MPLIATPAVVLQTYRYSESSKVVRLATRDLGVQSAIAKGVLRPKSRFGAALEFLSEGEAQLYFRDSRELHTLAAFDVTNLRRGLALDMARFAGAAALAQVMLKMAPPAPLPAAYDTLTAGLELLASAPPPAADPRRFVVGTAGHIDHGKTALVKALTGVDTDRWEEEKRRGITIDLGFAPLPLDDGIQASVVDVPGHEGFVRNMLAGATGIDVALLVIAADEGIMPQTEEHLAIVELLGVRRGIPVLTKRDLVDAEWLGMVRTEVAERLSRSRVRWHAPLAVSALSGEGLDELRTALVAIAADLADRPVDDLFRLPIDRVFALAGAGTVVTGSTWSGTVEAGASVRLLALGRAVRARAFEGTGEEAHRAASGGPTGLPLVG